MSATSQTGSDFGGFMFQVMGSYNWYNSVEKSHFGWTKLQGSAEFLKQYLKLKIQKFQQREYLPLQYNSAPQQNTVTLVSVILMCNKCHKTYHASTHWIYAWPIRWSHQIYCICEAHRDVNGLILYSVFLYPSSTQRTLRFCIYSAI